MAFTNHDAYTALQKHRETFADRPLRKLFDEDPKRFDTFSTHLDDLLFDYSKNWLDGTTLDLLVRLAEEANLGTWIHKLFSGAKINTTEDRAVLHVALRNRSNRPIRVDGEDVMPKVNAVLEKMRGFTEAVRQGTWRGHTGEAITDIVNIGIGGSDLGPHMVTEALR
ncbi:MAG: glucose-6-phosphate isomerase, partial [Deltaproteobacteria bacterium]|nr:glucose-6-phosphate isomerase [Deltaproteobacteria bacterium]